MAKSMENFRTASTDIANKAAKAASDAVYHRGQIDDVTAQLAAANLEGLDPEVIQALQAAQMDADSSYSQDNAADKQRMAEQKQLEQALQAELEAKLAQNDSSRNAMSKAASSLYGKRVSDAIAAVDRNTAFGKQTAQELKAKMAASEAELNAAAK